MLLSEFKNHLKSVKQINFVRPNGIHIPPYFHITEVGQVTKRFIDCGGTVRTESAITMQLWENTDYDHRLQPRKLIGIIDLSIKKLHLEDLPLVFEYQNNTIQKYGVTFNQGVFELTLTKTACLDTNACGITPTETRNETENYCNLSKNECC